VSIYISFLWADFTNRSPWCTRFC